MKTAEETLREQIKLSDSNISTWEKGRIIEAMKTYALEACKEQREICAGVENKIHPVLKSKNAILNARAPELK